MPTTPIYGLRYPLSSDPADVPTDMSRLATDVETTLSTKAVTSTDTRTTNRVPVWNGTAWVYSPITTAMIADSAVTAIKIADGNVGTAELADNSITNAKMQANSVANANLQANSVANSNIQNDSVTQAKMADNAIGTAEILADAITQAKMADNSVGTNEILNGSITIAKLASGVLAAAGMYLDTSGINADYNYRDAGPLNIWFNTNSTYFATTAGVGGIYANLSGGYYLALGMMQLNLGAPHSPGYQCGCALSGTALSVNGSVSYEAGASPGGVNYNNGISALAWGISSPTSGQFWNIGGWTNWSGSVSFRLAVIRLGS